MRFQRRSKYNATKTEIDGWVFDSKAEARRYKELKLLEAAGEIALHRVHPRFAIELNGKHICTVILDFQYLQGNEFIYEDVKGKDNALSRLKRKLVEAAYSIKVTVVKPFSRSR